MATAQQLVIERTGQMTTHYSEVDFPAEPGPQNTIVPGTPLTDGIPRCPHGVYDPHGDGAACTLCQTDYDGQIGQTTPHLGPSDLFSGFQVEPESRPRADAPEWVFDDAFLRRLLTEAKQGADRPINIARWAASLYLYYRCGWPTVRIGTYLGISAGSVQQILHRAQKRAEGMLGNVSTLQ